MLCAATLLLCGYSPHAARPLDARADTAAAYLEAVQLAGFEEREARKIFGVPRDLPRLALKGLPPQEAAARFHDQVNKYLRRLAKADTKLK